MISGSQPAHFIGKLHYTHTAAHMGPATPHCKPRVCSMEEHTYISNYKVVYSVHAIMRVISVVKCKMASKPKTKYLELRDCLCQKYSKNLFVN